MRVYSYGPVQRKNSALDQTVGNYSSELMLVVSPGYFVSERERGGEERWRVGERVCEGEGESYLERVIYLFR